MTYWIKDLSDTDPCGGCATPNQCGGCDLAATSGDRFAGVVKAALDTYAVNKNDIAFNFGVAPSAVLRWAAGTAAPCYWVKKLVIEHLEKAMKGTTP